MRKNCSNSSTARAALPGFTLIELTCVLLIIALFSVVAIPMFASALARRRVESAATRVAEDLNRARDYARTTSTAQTVTFDPNSNSYTISPMPDPAHPNQNYTVLLGQDPYNTDIVAADFGNDPILVYNGFGWPDTGGTVTLAVGDHTRTVTVHATSGIASAP